MTTPSFWLLLLLLPCTMFWIGIWRRFCGGLLAEWTGSNLGGTQVTRAVYGAMVGLSLGAMLSYPGISGLEVGTILGASAVAGVVGMAWGYPRIIDPRKPFESHMCPEDWPETVVLALNCAMHTAPTFLLGAVMTWNQPSYPVIGFLIAGLGGPAYWLAKAYTPAWRDLGFEEWAPDQKRWIIQPRALTEIYEGALFGLGLWVAFVLPKFLK